MALRDVVLQRRPNNLRDPRGSHGRPTELPDSNVPVHPARGAVAV